MEPQERTNLIKRLKWKAKKEGKFFEWNAETLKILNSPKGVPVKSSNKIKIRYS